MGWKVHRLTKKEFCHSNETWHALNSTFPDTNCIVSLKKNPHWISSSRLWKVVLETSLDQPGKLMKGVLFHQDSAPAHKSVVAMDASHDCHGSWNGLITLPSDAKSGEYWHHLTIFCSPTWKKTTWLGSSIWPMMRSYLHLQLRTFSRIGMRASIPQESTHCNTDGRSVWTTGETLWKNKFDHCIIVSLWTFQPTLVSELYMLTESNDNRCN